jgi:hypothetical protein
LGEKGAGAAKRRSAGEQMNRDWYASEEIDIVRWRDSPRSAILMPISTSENEFTCPSVEIDFGRAMPRGNELCQERLSS